MVQSDPLGCTLGRAHRLRGRRGLQAVGPRGVVSQVPSRVSSVQTGTATTAAGQAFRVFSAGLAGNRSLILRYSSLCTSITFTKKRQFSWQDWPAPMRNPRSAEVAAFAAEHRDPPPSFFQFSPSGRADRQLAAAAAAGRESGLSIGLYRDLRGRRRFRMGRRPGQIKSWLPRVHRSVHRPTHSAAADRIGVWRQSTPLVLRRQGFAPLYRGIARQHAARRDLADRPTSCR